MPGWLLKKPKLEGRRGRGVRLLTELFSQRLFNVINIDVHFFLYSLRWLVMPVSFYV